MIFWSISQTCLFEHIKKLLWIDLTSRCSNLPYILAFPLTYAVHTWSVHCKCALMPKHWHIHRPQMKLLKGNVFTPVCQWFCSQGVYILACTGADTPLGRHHPKASTPVRHLLPSAYWDREPPNRRLLLRMVCIILECILVLTIFTFGMHCDRPRLLTVTCLSY